MSRRKEIGILVVLMMVLGVVLYRDLRPGSVSGSDAPETSMVLPLRIPNPALHLDRLAQIRQMDYAGNHRNIFSATAAPAAPVKSGRVVQTAASAKPSGPPIPQGLQVPLTFYGMAVDPKTSQKLAFFTNGDNVYIASVGNTLLGHFRLLDIASNTVQFEDITTGQTATLRMTPPVTPPSTR